MLGVPIIRHKLKSRRAGTFGLSGSGRVAEWVTRTWFRFECFLSAVLSIALVASLEGLPIEKLGIALLSPVGAVVFVITLKVLGAVSYFVPGINKVFGWSRLAFVWIFSRLIVEEVPEIDMPLWHSPPR